MLKSVVQPESGGCGIASAAALAGVSYGQAKQVAASLGIRVEDSTLWSSTAPLRRLLKRLGVRAGDGERPFTTWEALPDRALLAIKWHRERGIPHWHWVVFVREPEAGNAQASAGKRRARGGGVVLDPATRLKRHVRTDFGRMRPKWFIEIL